MRQRCEYCGNWIEDTDEVCPHCGGPNDHLMASAEGVPKTIDELKAFCERHKLPLKDMRFFIGEDYKGARAFGIYQDGPNFVVYKNKADGSRAVRYRGKDEAYAVNELYQKMKSEVSNQRNHAAAKHLKEAKREKHNVGMIAAAVGITLFLAVGVIAAVTSGGPKRGYYRYEDQSYYYLDNSWYSYDDDTDDWYWEETPPSTLADNAGDYWEGSSYDTSWETSDFEDTTYYQDYWERTSSSSDDDDDWDDDDWDWDSSDSWDSSSTDWDSDW